MSRFWHENGLGPKFWKNCFDHVMKPMIPHSSPPMGHCRFFWGKKSLYVGVRPGWNCEHYPQTPKTACESIFLPGGLASRPEIFWVSADHMAADLTWKVVWDPNLTKLSYCPKMIAKQLPGWGDYQMCMPHIITYSFINIGPISKIASKPTTINPVSDSTEIYAPTPHSYTRNRSHFLNL